jgi:hypothetical protein
VTGVKKNGRYRYLPFFFIIQACLEPVLFINPMPELKKIKPRMANIQGLCVVKFLPNIPSKPTTRPIPPARTRMIPKMLFAPTVLVNSPFTAIYAKLSAVVNHP